MLGRQILYLSYGGNNMQNTFMSTNLLLILGWVLGGGTILKIIIYLILYLVAKHNNDIVELYNLRSKRYLVEFFGIFFLGAILITVFGYCLYYYLLPLSIFTHIFTQGK